MVIFVKVRVCAVKKCENLYVTPALCFNVEAGRKEVENTDEEHKWD